MFGFLMLLSLLHLCNGNCEEDTFKYSNGDQIISNNSYVYMTDLATNVAIGSSCTECTQWLFPNGVNVNVGVMDYGIFILTAADANNLRFNPPGNNECSLCQNGVYTCKKGSNGGILLLGVYGTNNNKLLTSTISVKLNAIDYFVPLLSLELDCASSSYPPTFVTWFRNNNTINDNVTDYTKILTDSPTSNYISKAVLSNYTNTSGDYFCKVNSTSLSNEMISNSLPVTVSESPEFTVLKFLNDTAIYMEWQHTANTVVYDHIIIYKDIDTTEVYYAECGIVQYCVVANLTTNLSYLFVLAPNDNSTDIFQPTLPTEIDISEPDIVNLTSLVLKEADNFNYGSLDISWSSFITETMVTVVYTGSCGSNICSNAIKTAINGTNTTLENLIPGIEYSLLIWGVNAIGKGYEDTVIINQDITVPPSSPLGISVTDRTSSSINISWNYDLSCCNFSGEDPIYILTLTTTGIIVDNDTVYNEDTYYSFDNLEPLTEYHVTIIAINSAGMGWNETISVFTLEVTSNSISSSSTIGSISTIVPTNDGQDLVIFVVIGIASLTMFIVAGAFICCIAIVFVLRSKNSPNGVAGNPNRVSDEEVELKVINGQYQRLDFLDKRYQAPYLIEFPTDTKAIIGETVRFLVQVKGYPKPSLSWEYQGEPISPVGPIQIFSDGSLVIHDVKPQYGGRYTFIASNPTGIINRVINLKVIDEDEEENENEMEYEKIRECRSVVMEHKPIPIEILEKYVETHHASNNDPFQFLFTSLQTFPGRSYPTDIAIDNRPRNRYRNIIPYNNNTVQLLPLEEWKAFHHTYINASYIDGYNTSNKFIATQGPTEETVSDFWRMIHQKKCRIIIALCNLHESNKVKCEQYWPASMDTPEEHGPYIVRLLSEELYSNFTVRTMELLLSDGSQDSSYIKQYHYTSWPDHGVPENGSPLILFHQKIMTQYHNTQYEPIIVHCSAGVGRTGTFIALDIALDQIEQERMVDIVGIVNHMREQRMKMIQTCNQLTFLHDVILEYTLCGSTLINIAKLSESLDILYTEDKQTTKNGFQIQFQLIQRLTPKLKKFKCSIAEGHIDKNRPNIPLPSDSRRVTLHNPSNDYINASFIDGFQQKKAFIVAQSPLPQTTCDFWQMILQHNSSIILMLCQLTENSKVVCDRYWPVDTTEALIFDCYSIKLIKEVYITENIIRRTLGVKDMNSGHLQTVTQIQITNWLPDGQCSNHQGIGVLHNEVMNAQRITGAANNPIVVHCSDCVTRSGIYCATHVAIDQARLEQVIDIFQTVKSIRMQRPGSVPSETNYITIHDFVRAYLVASAFDLYLMQPLT